MRQARAAARLERRPLPPEDTGVYGQARLRLPLDRLQELIARAVTTVPAGFDRLRFRATLRLLLVQTIMERLPQRLPCAHQKIQDLPFWPFQR